MFTKNDIILSTSSGSGLMEMAVKSCTKKEQQYFQLAHLVTDGSKCVKRMVFRQTNSSLS